MATSKLNDVLGFYCRVWAAHWRYKGNRYIPTDRDRVEVKRFLAGLLEDVPTDEFISRAKLYLAEDWWRQHNHPAWAFFRHFSRWIKVNERKHNGGYSEERTPVEINCSYCGQKHLDNYVCEALR